MTAFNLTPDEKQRIASKMLAERAARRSMKTAQAAHDAAHYAMQEEIVAAIVRIRHEMKQHPDILPAFKTGATLARRLYAMTDEELKAML